MFTFFPAEILHALLPESLREGSPTGFAATGHIGKLYNWKKGLVNNFNILL